MSAPSKPEPKQQASTRKEVHDLDAAELQDRVTHLRDQERAVQREIAERRAHEAVASTQLDRERSDQRYVEQAEALQIIERQARGAGRDFEHGARRLAGGVASTISTLIPPALRRPTLLVDVAFNTAIAMLNFERDLLNEVLAPRITPSA